MKILFSGYRIAGYDCLQYLIDQGEDIVAVLTHDDKLDPVKIGTKSVKKLAQQHNIPIFLAENEDKHLIKNFINKIKPEVHLSAFYSKKIPEEVIEMIPINTNIHGGKLPEYKGCFSPIWTILNGEKTTEVTLQLMGKKIDSGEIIKTVKLDIGDDETGGELYYRVTDVTIKLFKEIYQQLKNGDPIKLTPQPKGGHYYKRKLPNDGFVNLNDDPKKVYNFIRALTFPPLEPAHTIINGKKIYLYSKTGDIK